MIPLNPGTAIMLYLGITLVLLSALWLFQHYRTRNKEIVTSEEEISVCEFCQFVYLGESAKKLTRCPQCKSLNKQYRE